MMVERRSTWRSHSPGYRVFKVDSRSCRTSHQLYSCFADDNHLGSYRADVWVQRHLAASDQYRNDDSHLSDGISDSENPKPRTETIHLKLDELIRVTKGARNMMLDLEHMDDESLKRLRDIYERLGSQARTDKK